MKKLLSIFCFLVAISAFSQIDEGFEDGIPDSWSQYKTYDDDPGFEINTDQAYSGSSSVFHTFAYLSESDNSDSWLVTDAQTISVGVNEFLSFWYQQLDTDMLYEFSGVYISTGSNNPIDNPDDFTLLQEFDADYGYSDSEWSPYNKDLSDYEGQTIYIAFRYSGNNSHVFMIDDVSLSETPDCVSPSANFTVNPDCDNGAQFLVDIELTDLGMSDELTIADNQGGDVQTVSETGAYSFGPYDNGTPVQITLENPDHPDCSLQSDTLEQDYCPEISVDCDQDPVNTVLCYDAFENIEVTYTSTDPEGVLNLVVNQSNILQYGSDFEILDSDGSTVLYSGTGDAGNLSGVSVQSTGDQLTVSYDSGFQDCEAEGLSAIDLTVSCADCINPQASFETIADCENGEQFLVDVDLSDMGSASDIDISDNQGSDVQTVSSTGTYEFGPYDNGTDVIITVTNGDDQTCSISSDELTEEYCSEVSVHCDEGPVNSVICYQETELLEVTYTADDAGSSLNLTVNSGLVPESGNEFKILDSDGTTELYSGTGDEGDLADVSAQSTGDQITIQYQAGYYSCDDSSYAPFDISVACATCENPQADFEVMPDCDNGQQFLINVDLTDLGSANTIEISDDQGSDVQNVSSTGTYEFGPYDNQTEVKISLTNTDDNTCEITSQTLTQDYCSALTVQCGQGPTVSDICYQAGEDVEVTYTSDDPDGVLNLTVNSGMIYDLGQDFKVIDSDGTTVLYSGLGDGGDLSGLSFQSSGDQISISYSPLYISCDAPDYSALNIEVACAECINPQATFTPVNDCGDDNGLFTVDVDVTDFGTAQSVEVTDDQGGVPQTLTEPGTVTFGPYPYDNAAHITVSNADDPSCSITSDDIIQNFCGVIGYPDAYTNEELVTDVLIDNPCAQVSNITSTTGTDFSDNIDGIGYFTNNSAVFPIDSGVVLSSGAITSIDGPQDGYIGDGSLTGWPGDDDIEDLIHEIEGDNFSQSYNASVLEFDFVPVNDHISFDYLFVSNEYGGFQCNYTDTFAFFLTDEDGNTQNLAVVPGTDTPVTVRTIRDAAYNDGCESQNEEYFDAYYGDPNGLPLELDPTNFLGRTVQLTAEADVNPGQTYHIKLAIADRGDGSYDSAVFLKAGSFDLGEIDLGDDLTVENGNAPCENDDAVLDSGIDDSEFVELSWYKDDNLIEGEEGSTLEVTEPGTYTVIAIYGGGCVISDEIEVEFAPFPEFDFDDENPYSLCGTDQVTLDGTPSNIDSLVNELTYTWYSGDDEIAGETDSTLVVDQPGTYTVEVTSEEGCAASHSFEVTEASFTVDLGEDQALCDQDSYELTADLIDADNADQATYEWTGPNGTLDQNGSSITVSESGLYTVTVTIGDCSTEESVDIQFNESPQFDLGDDIATTDLTNVILDATPDNMNPDEVTYEWDYEGDPIPENGPTVNAADYGYGTYTVTIYGEDPSCDATQSITITEEEVNCNVSLNPDKAIDNEINYCEDDGVPNYTITFTADFEAENASSDNVTYTWYKNGDEIAGANESSYELNYDEQGEYSDEITVEAELEGSCSVTASLSTDVVISPYEHPCKITQGLSPGNNDGKNDNLDLSFLNDRSGIAEFEVFNRYGVKVFHQNNYRDSWHGQDDDGDELTTGTYYYIIKMKNEDPVFGWTKRGWIYVNQKVN